MADIRTYVYGATYDSWNRVQTMTYPDGEVVTYHYNAALNKEFDIDKSIVIQGASLKAKVAEHTIDTVIDKSDNKKNVKR
ncbi:hypothetical protein [Prevotella histicola]